MTFLERATIERKGRLLKETRIDRYRKRMYYLYNGNEYFIDVYCPSEFAVRNSSSGDLQTIQKSIEGKEKKTMAKNLNLKKEKAEKSLNLKKDKNQNGMSLEGFSAVRELKDAINGNFESIQKQLKEQSEKIEKLYQVVFNNENDKVISLLTELIEMNKKVSAIATTEKEKPVEEKPVEEKPVEVSEGVFERFKKLYGKDIAKENFLQAAKADFSSFEAMEESLKKLEQEWKEKGNGFIVARRSSKEFKPALWETFQGKQDSKASSPVYDAKHFSKALNLSIDTVKDVISQVKEWDSFDESDEDNILEALLDEGMPEEKEKEFDEFIEFLRSQF